ncbi:MAG: TnsA endonuclease N-terminal domain-containing protein [Desulfovibrio sp.]
MAKRSGGLTEAKIKKWIKEGRGQDHGPNYKPWLTVRDIPSKGRSHRVFGYHTKRTHHLFSDLELAVFLSLDWSPNTIDIREQFPLQQQVTLELAQEAGIKHPRVAGTFQVMSSDFLVDSSSPDLPKFVLQAKYTKDLNNPRTVEKLELERRYWAHKSIPWRIVTEKEISATVFQNIEWLYPNQQISYPLTELSERLEFYAHHFAKNPSTSIITVSKSLDVQYEQEAGQSLAEMRELFASRLLSFDLNIPFKKLTPAGITFVDNASIPEVLNVYS